MSNDHMLLWRGRRSVPIRKEEIVPVGIDGDERYVRVRGERFSRYEIAGLPMYYGERASFLTPKLVMVYDLSCDPAYPNSRWRFGTYIWLGPGDQIYAAYDTSMAGAFFANNAVGNRDEDIVPQRVTIEDLREFPGALVALDHAMEGGRPRPNCTTVRTILLEQARNRLEDYLYVARDRATGQRAEIVATDRVSAAILLGIPNEWLVAPCVPAEYRATFRRWLDGGHTSTEFSALAERWRPGTHYDPRWMLRPRGARPRG